LRLANCYARTFSSWAILARASQDILDFIFIHVVIVDVRFIRCRVYVETQAHVRSLSLPRKTP